MRHSGLLLAALALTARFASAAEPAQLESTPLAQAFGSAPIMWGVQLSPDGTKISVIQMHPEGYTLARVIGLQDGSAAVVLSGNPTFDVAWCEWANSERLLCGLRTMASNSRATYAVTRLVSAKIDGTEMKELVSNRLGVDNQAQFQDRVIDWLPDDEEHVLIQVPGRERFSGQGTSRLNIYTGSMTNDQLPRPGVTTWITDGHGVARLYLDVNERGRRWLVRDTPDAAWSFLHSAEFDDLDDAFQPLGFAESRNELLFYDDHEGRRALFSYDLANGRQRRLIFSHPTFDVAGVQALGRFRRLVAATYIDDVPQRHFFDARIESIHRGLSEVFPGMTVNITDESDDQRYYLVFVSSATDPGSFYRFDAMTNVVAKIAGAYPSLADRTLAPMQPVRYAADDGVEIPAYLTLPQNRSGRVPAVVLPHGGPSARDYWSYDFLTQFLAASGYAVLQANYRGSDGYGKEWRGDGGFQNWRRAIADIEAGAEYLVREGIADPDKLCAVGWSFGGYAALMSVIEHPQRYQCVVSIAGVTDPKSLGFNAMNFVGGRGARAFIGTDEEVRKHGSPVERVAEIGVPVLLFHPVKDANVPFVQGTMLAGALRRVDADFELIEYENAEHSIQPERYRIDLLARLGAFLDEHL